MKKFTILFSILLFAIYSNASNWTSINGQSQRPISQKLISSSESQIVIHFSLGGFSTTTVETPRGKAAVISVPKMVSLSIVGAPDVPKYAVSSIIGDRSDMDVRITSSKYVEFENFEIAPSKGDFSRKIDPKTVPYTYGNAYNTNAFYPSVNAEMQEPYILRNFRGQAVTILPFVYNPITKVLRVYHELTVELFANGKNGQNQLNRSAVNLKEDVEFKHIYTNHFINYHEAQNRYPILAEQGNLLIICHGPYMEAMQPFVAWKKIIGRPTQIVDVATIGTNTTAILNYVRNYYNTNGLTHLLLVGDHQHVPSFNNTSSGGFSDNYYGYLSGNDSYNELFVGRISAETVGHVQTQVHKIITHERDLDQTATWLSLGTGIARNEGAGAGHNGGEADYVHMDYIRDSLLRSTYTTVYREYDGGVPGLVNTTAAQISSRINAGTSLINYCNHGSINSWSVANYSTSHVSALTNTARWPVMWVVACDNGQFTSGSCFAEAWMRATSNGQPSGALGAMMSWISQPWQPPMTGQDEMVTILVGSYQNNIKRTFGGNSINGSMKMIDLHGTSGRSTHDTWILFGDPSMIMRTATPAPIAVSHLPAIFIGMSEFTVNANAEGALVTLTMNGEILGSATVTGGEAKVTFPALNNVGVMKIAVFGYNRVTYLKDIEIIPAAGPFVAYMSHVVNGATGSQVHYDEDVVLGVQLKNLGIEPASLLNVTLRSTSPFVTIMDSTEVYGTMTPNQVLSISNAFAIKVSNNVPNNTMLPFKLIIAGTEATWNANMSLTALAPQLSIGNFTVSDPTGNNNGRLDRGETAEIRITLNNVGLSQAKQAIGNLVFNSPFVTINTAEATFATINAGQSVIAVFSVTVSPAAPIGQAASFNVSFQAGAYTAQKAFSTKIGLILEDFESGTLTAFPYTFAGNKPWLLTIVNPFEGNFSAKSGVITHSQSSQMILQFEVSASDSISFFRKVSSESGYDFLRFYIDNVKVGEWAGTIGWSKVAYPVAAGMRTFKWEYMKDNIVSSGEDCAWIDNISFPPPFATSVWAGNNAVVCAGSTHQLEAIATHFNTIVWSSSGTGTFNNIQIVNPVYTPSAADIAAGSVVVKATVTRNLVVAESTKTLTFQPLPVAFAGAESTICAGEPYTVSQATAINHSAVLWTSSGTGTFNNPALLKPVYTPSAQDIASGKVTLTLVATGLNACGTNTSNVDVNIRPLAVANAGPESTICSGTTYTAAQATAQHYSTVLWTSSGTGTFNDASIVKPIYTPSAQDIAAGKVVLTLTATGIGGCGVDASNLTLNFQPLPQAYAGIESAVCHGENFTPSLATAQHFSTLLWSTSGTGTFSNSSAIQPIYTPSAQDLTIGNVTLTLVSTGLNSCGQATSNLKLNFNPLPTALMSGSQSICSESNATISVNLTGASPWTLNLNNGIGAVVVTSSPYTRQVSPQSTTTYNPISVSDANGCTKAGEGQAVVTVRYVPLAPIKPAAPDTVDHAFVTSSNLSIQNVATATSYVWQFTPTTAGTITPNGIQAQVSWNATYKGKAFIKTAAVNDCGQGPWSNEATVVVKSTVGLDEKLPLSMRIYPNPSNGQINLVMSKSVLNTSTITVTNVIGEVVYSKVFESMEANIANTLQLNHLPHGVYVITIENGTSRLMQRVTIKR